MVSVFAKNLSSKQVMATDGTEIGILFNIVMDIGSGEIIDLIVKPDMSLDTSRYKTDEQYILLPFESVRAIKDYIVVDKNMARGLVSEPVTV
ncbi:MAG: PRC-barrel domain-containing protein [Methanolobus sp.]